MAQIHAQTVLIGTTSQGVGTALTGVSLGAEFTTGTVRLGIPRYSTRSGSVTGKTGLTAEVALREDQQAFNVNWNEAEVYLNWASTGARENDNTSGFSLELRDEGALGTRQLRQPWGGGFQFYRSYLFLSQGPGRPALRRSGDNYRVTPTNPWWLGLNTRQASVIGRRWTRFRVQVRMPDPDTTAVDPPVYKLILKLLGNFADDNAGAVQEALTPNSLHGYVRFYTETNTATNDGALNPVYINSIPTIFPTDVNQIIRVPEPPREQVIGRVNISLGPVGDSPPSVTQPTIPVSIGQAPADDRPIPTDLPAPSDLTFWQYHNEEWVDITPFVAGASWRYGFSRPQHAGLASPMEGAILLTDPDGYFNPLLPNDRITPFPGAPIRIQRGSTFFFQGYSQGVSVREQGDADVYHPVLRIAGVLKRIQEGAGSNDRLEGEQLVSEVISIVLGNNGVPENLIEVTPNSRIVVFDAMVNQASLLAQGNTRIKPGQALNELAILEGGRVYERPSGAVVYHTRLDRNVANAHFYEVGGEGELTLSNVRFHPMESYVLNQVGARLDNFVSSGTREIQFYEVDSDKVRSWPQAFTVPAQAQANEFEYILDRIAWDAMGITGRARIGIPGLPEDSFVESWQEPVTDSPYPVRKVGFEQELHISFTNPTNTPYNVVIQQPRGDVQVRNYSLLYTPPRNAESEAYYGVRGFQYPESLAVDREQALVEIQAYAQNWSGVDAQGKAAPPIGLDATVLDVLSIAAGTRPFEVSDVVYLTYGNPTGKQFAVGKAFWVEGCEYTWDAQAGTLNAQLLLLTAQQPVTRDGVVLGQGEQRIGRVLIESVTAEPYEALIGRVDIPIPEQRIGNVIYIPAPERRIGNVIIPLPRSANPPTSLAGVGYLTYAGGADLVRLSVYRQYLDSFRGVQVYFRYRRKGGSWVNAPLTAGSLQGVTPSLYRYSWDGRNTFIAGTEYEVEAAVDYSPQYVTRSVANQTAAFAPSSTRALILGIDFRAI